MSQLAASASKVRILPHNRGAAQQVKDCVLEGRYCTLLGPRFSGKTAILRDVADELASDPTLVCVYLSLGQTDCATEATFFSSMAELIARELALPRYDDLVSPVASVSSPTFRGFLQAALDSLRRDLVLMLDDLELVPSELLRALLSSLRALHMEQSGVTGSHVHRLVVAAAGALSLATHAVGEASPFRGIAFSVQIGDLSDEESRALIDEQLAANQVDTATDVSDRLLEATRGNANLIRLMVRRGSAAATRMPHGKRLTNRQASTAIKRFLHDEAPSYQPLQEAVRLIEDSPDLLRCLLLLLERPSVPRQELPLPLTSDFDPLYLTGLVREDPKGSYRLRNGIYRQFLADHFTPQRVGHLLKIAGLWNLAIDHLSASARQGDPRTRSDLLDIAVTAIHASDDYQHAANYAARALAIVFDIEQPNLWLALPNDGQLTLIYPAGEARTISLSGHEPEALAFQEGYTNRREDADGARRAIPLRGTNQAPIGVLTVSEHSGAPWQIEGTEAQFQGYLSQLGHAFQEMITRRQPAEILRDIAVVLGGAGDANVLELSLEQIARVIPFDSASVQLLNESKTALNIRVCQGFASSLEIRRLSFKLTGSYPNVRVWQRKAPQRFASIHDEFGHLANPKYQMADIKSWLGVPLVVGDEAIGVITLDKREPDFYTLDHENLALLIANHAAMAIQRAQLESWKEEERQLIRTIARMTGSLRDSDQIWRLMLDGALHLTGAEAGNISLVDTIGNKLTDIVQHGFPDTLPPSRAIAGDSVQGWVALNRHSALIYDVAAQPEWQDIYLNELDTTASELAVPIFRGDTGAIIGIINLESQRSHAFTKRDQRLLEDLAVHADLALDNARRYREVEEHSQRLDALYKSAHTIAQAGLELDAVLQAILGQAVAVTGATFGTIQLVDDDDLVFETAWPAEQKSVLVERIGRMPIAGAGITARAVREKRTQLVRDVAKDAEFVPSTGVTGSELVVLLERDGKPLGVLNVEHPEPDVLNEHDLKLLEGLSHLAIVAMQNAERYKELEKTRDTLLSTQAVAWLGIFGADWKHTIHQSTFSVGNDINGLRQLLRRVNTASASVKEGLSALEHIEEVINRIRSVPAAAETETSVDTCVDDTLEEKVGRWSRQHQHIAVKLDLHCRGVRAFIGTPIFNIAIEKLINNALKAMADGGKLYVSTRSNGHTIKIVIRDTGPGIPDHARGLFLERPVPRKQSSNGTGTGALMAKFIAQINGGNLTWQPNPEGQGTELLLTLPVVAAEPLIAATKENHHD
jgi:GAF domain-containing protein